MGPCPARSRPLSASSVRASRCANTSSSARASRAVTARRATGTITTGSGGTAASTSKRKLPTGWSKGGRMSAGGRRAVAVSVVHYLNQFFGGVGGEEHASHPIEVREGAVGPGRALQAALGDGATIAATVVGGDTYVADHRDDALAAVARVLGDLRPDVVVAGPAFDAGRYGVACGEVCRLAASEGIPAVTAMYPENPAVALFRTEVPIVPTAATAVGMG